MGAYYLEGCQWLAVPSSKSALRQDFPMGPPQTKRGAVIGGASAAHWDAKPEAERVEVLNTAQSPADKPIIEMFVGCGSITKLQHTSTKTAQKLLETGV
jgi:hypothetical protein